MNDWDYEVLSVKPCKPYESIFVIAKSNVDGLEDFIVKFDCRKFYEYMINRQGDIYWVVPHKGLDYMIPFAAEDFHKRFEDVTMEGNKHEV